MADIYCLHVKCKYILVMFDQSSIYAIHCTLHNNTAFTVLRLLLCHSNSWRSIDFCCTVFVIQQNYGTVTATAMNDRSKKKSLSFGPNWTKIETTGLFFTFEVCYGLVLFVLFQGSYQWHQCPCCPARFVLLHVLLCRVFKPIN